MKVIITGATGFVGSQVLAYALVHPSITHIVLLQRRELPEQPSAVASTTKRVETVILEDFSHYPDSVLNRLAGAEAVLWALGGKHDNFADLATAERVNVEFTRAAAEAFERSLVPSVPAGRKLRFVLCSGKGAEWDRQASLWFLAETRRMKGAAEQAVFAMAKAQPDGSVEAYTCRPAVILGARPGFAEWLHGLLAPSVTVKELAATMVDLGVAGDPKSFWEFDMIGKKGKQIVKERGI